METPCCYELSSGQSHRIRFNFLSFFTLFFCKIICSNGTFNTIGKQNSKYTGHVQCIHTVYKSDESILKLVNLILAFGILGYTATYLVCRRQ